MPGVYASVYIDDTDGISRTVNYDYTGNTVAFYSLTVDLNGGTGSSTNTLLMAGNSLMSGTETVGQYGNGTFVQTGGTNSVNSLTLGASQFINGGAYSTYVADTAGFGIYSLGGTATLTAGVESIGATSVFSNYGQPETSISGTGLFNQTLGTNNVGILKLGDDDGAVGTYNLQGGSLTAGTVYFCSNSTFSQTGGSVSYTTLIQTSGSLVAGQPGGLLSSPLVLSQGGSPANFNLQGGVLTSPSITVGLGGTLAVGGGSLACSAVNLDGGTLSLGALTLDGGLAIPTGNVASGAALPTLNLYAGTLAAEDAYLGSSAGASSFSQPGQITFTPSDLYVGYALGSTSVYMLAGGALSSGAQYVGYSGVGIFNQSGGTNVASTLSLGANQGATGIYTLSGAGSLIASEEDIGATSYTYTPGQPEILSSGVGVFTQTGGTNEASSLYLGNENGAAGVYNLQGGVLMAGTIFFSSNATFSQTGGMLSYSTLNQSGGSIVAGAAGGLFASPLTLAAGGSPINYVLTGGTLTSPTINVGAGGSFNMSGGALVCEEFNLNGGTATFPSIVLDTGVAVPTFSVAPGGSTPAFNLSSGTLAAVNTYLGQRSGVSLYAQPANPSFNTGTLYVAYNAASTAEYVLSAGSVAGSMNIGYSGAGTFVQTGGSVSAGYTWNLGTNVGASGAYLLSDGSLAQTVGDPNEYVGYGGAGEFIQSGGSNSMNGLDNGASLALGFKAGSSGTYILSGGTIYVDASTSGSSHGEEFVGDGGTGNFIQTGGTNQIGALSPIFDEYGRSPQLDAVLIGVQKNSSGLYTLGAGTLTVFDNNPEMLNAGNPYGGGAELVGFSGTGAFVQTGGTNSCAGHAGILYVGYSAGASGSYALSGGTLSTLNDGVTAQNEIAGSECIGYSGTGTFTQTGGSNACTGVDGSLYLGYNSGSKGVYTLGGGTLTAVNEQIGYNGNGTFTQTGGVNTTSNLYVGGGYYSGDFYYPLSTYILTGGELSVAEALIVEGGGSYGRLVLEGGTATVGSVSASNISLTGLAGANTYGNLTVMGDFQGGQLTLGIGGEPDNGEFGLLTVDGTASLYGGLDVTFLNGFVPAIGDTYAFLTAGNVTGAFNSMSSPYQVQVNYTPTGVSITFVPEPTALGLLAVAAGLLMRRRRNRGFELPPSS